MVLLLEERRLRPIIRERPDLLSLLLPTLITPRAPRGPRAQAVRTGPARAHGLSQKVAQVDHRKCARPASRFGAQIRADLSPWQALKCLALEGVGESDEALKTYAFLLAIQSFHPLERLPGDEVPSPNGQHAPPADEDDAGVPESAAEQQTLVKVKQPAKKPKGKGKSSKPMPKTAAVGGGAKAQAQSAVVDAASRDEIYSTTVLNVLTRFLKSHDKCEPVLRVQDSTHSADLTRPFAQSTTSPRCTARPGDSIPTRLVSACSLFSLAAYGLATGQRRER